MTVNRGDRRPPTVAATAFAKHVSELQHLDLAGRVESLVAVAV
jgi:hypothetical protein